MCTAASAVKDKGSRAPFKPMESNASKKEPSIPKACVSEKRLREKRMEETLILVLAQVM